MRQSNEASNGEITSGQLGKVLYLFTLGSAALIVPTAIIDTAGQDGWLSMLLATPIHFLFVYIYLALAARFPRLTLAQYVNNVAGAWFGRAITLTYVFFFLILSALVLRNMTDFLGKSVLPQTPDGFLSLTFMVVIIYGVYLGIETIARTGEILFGWSLFVIMIIVVTLINQMDLHNFSPMLGDGWIKSVKGIYPVLGFPFAECVFITAILPMVRHDDRNKLKRAVGISVAISGIVSTLIIVLLISVLGVSETSRSPFAVYEMAKSINIEEIIVRVEILFAMVWIGTVFMKLVLTVYSLVVFLSQMLGLRTYKPLVFPIGLFIIPLSSIIYRNDIHATLFAMDVWTVYSVSQGVLIPLLILVLAAILKRRSGKDGRFPIQPPERKGKAATQRR